MNEALLRSIRALGHVQPTPIQEQAIPRGLEGRDLLGCAQTGTGKTAAFVLPMIQRLMVRSEAPPGRARPIRALVLSPTRELAAQIGESFASYARFSGLKHTTIFGGVSQVNQIRALRAGVDVLIATPGRLCDLLEQRCIDLRDIEYFVLDEADRMLDQGFLPAIRRVLRLLPPAGRRQSMLFSATMPKEIEPLVSQVLRSPVRVEVTPVASTPEKVEQAVYLVETEHKRALLEHLLEDASMSRAIVFTRTKHGANRLVQHLAKAQLRAEAIHGNKSQGARERALGNFRNGTTRVLVATDVAARGIDIGGITHVVNYDLPADAESYVHRIGRTARAGKTGVALSFCSRDERSHLRGIERLIQQRVAVAAHPFEGARDAAGPSQHPRPALPSESDRTNSPRSFRKRRRTSGFSR